MSASNERNHPRKLDPLAALLSYLVPGLGQVVQGRIGKGVLFFICLYVMFFYGMWLGQWKNVWLPDTRALPDVRVGSVKLEGTAKDIWYRREFIGQFWMGAAVWPAIVQYSTMPAAPNGMFGKYMQAPTEEELNDLQRGVDKSWDLGWVYTVIAGVLNVLVIYDAFAGPVVKEDEPTGTSPNPTDPGSGGAA